MCSNAVVTNREVKNKVTGLDLYVSDYQEIPHRKKNSFQYHVIVITNLFYYKRSDLKDSDVVQFMVSKTFEEFEALYHQLYKRFPSVIFPELPKKSLFSNDTDAKFDCMNKVLRMVAATQKLCSSPMLIAFLKEIDAKESPSSQSLQSISPIVLPAVSNNYVLPVVSKNDVLPVVSKNDNIKEEDVSTVFSQDLMEEVDLFSVPNELIKDSEENLFETHNTQVFDLFLDKDNVKGDLHSTHKELKYSEDFLNSNEEEEEDLLKMLGNASKKENLFNVASPVSSSVLRARVSSNVEERAHESSNAEEPDVDFFKKTRNLSIRSQNQKSLKEDSGLDDLFGVSKKKTFFDDVSVDDIDLFSTSSNETSNKTDTSKNKSAIEFLTENFQTGNNEQCNKAAEAGEFVANDHLERSLSQKLNNESDDDFIAYDNKLNSQFTDVTHYNITGSLQEEIEQTDLLNSQNYGGLFISDSEVQNTNEHEQYIDDIMNYIAKHNLDEEVSLGF